MQEFSAVVAWQRGDQPFTDQRYSRAHEWQFDGGMRVMASSSPLSVPLPMSCAEYVDPEEALVAAASSCHMLFFLSIAARKGFIVDAYRDAALGQLARNAEGRIAMTRIALRPVIKFGGERAPAPDELAALHHQAHESCYVANSLKADIVVEVGVAHV